MKETYETKKSKLVYGLIRFYIDQALKFGSNIEHKPNVGDWVYEVSSIHPRKGKIVYFDGIGKLIKKGKNGDDWLILKMNGVKAKWNNADFYRLPNTVQELLK